MSTKLKLPTACPVKTAEVAWNQSAFKRFRTIWVTDFEFGQSKDLLPEIRCMTAHEMRSGERAAFWEDT